MGGKPIATLQQVTASNSVEVTDPEKVENLIQEYNPSIKYDLDANQLIFSGHDGFRIQGKDLGTEKYGGVGKFLHELKQYLAEGEELIVQVIGNEKCRFPIIAYQFRATPEAVHYTALSNGDGEEQVEEVER